MKKAERNAGWPADPKPLAAAHLLAYCSAWNEVKPTAPILVYLLKSPDEIRGKAGIIVPFVHSVANKRAQIAKRVVARYRPRCSQRRSLDPVAGGATTCRPAHSPPPSCCKASDKPGIDISPAIDCIASACSCLALAWAALMAAGSKSSIISRSPFSTSDGSIRTTSTSQPVHFDFDQTAAGGTGGAPWSSAVLAAPASARSSPEPALRARRCSPSCREI